MASSLDALQLSDLGLRAHWAGGRLTNFTPLPRPLPGRVGEKSLLPLAEKPLRQICVGRKLPILEVS